jgi:hypothetical protein
VLLRPVLAAVAALCEAVAEVVIIGDLLRILSRPSYVDFGGHLPHVGLALAGLSAAGLVVAGLAALFVPCVPAARCAIDLARRCTDYDLYRRPSSVVVAVRAALTPCGGGGTRPTGRWPGRRRPRPRT